MALLFNIGIPQLTTEYGDRWLLLSRSSSYVTKPRCFFEIGWSSRRFRCYCCLKRQVSPDRVLVRRRAPAGTSAPASTASPEPASAHSPAGHLAAPSVAAAALLSSPALLAAPATGTVPAEKGILIEVQKWIQPRTEQTLKICMAEGESEVFLYHLQSELALK